MSDAPKVFPLHGNQMEAVRPDEVVWLSASAGTGKTQVLSSRVLRLLLQPDVEPSQILCLTFTKAGAAEMAGRINDKLARWVRMDQTHLFNELQAIGANGGPGEIARARTLFAKVLDCPGGGLRIDTIHAFSQWLLAAFPLEAQLVPGARPMEDRERAMLARRVLSDLLVAAESDPLGDPQLLDAVAELSLRMGPDAVESYLLRCASAREAWFGTGAFQEPMRPRVLTLLGLPQDADEDWLAAMCADEAFDTVSLRRCMDTAHGWGTKTGLAAVDVVSNWLLGTPSERAASLPDLRKALLTNDGEIRSLASLSKVDPDYPGYCGRVSACIETVGEQAALLALADRLVPALRLGRAFAFAWEEAKLREGLIDFDDQIRRAAMADFQRSDRPMGVARQYAAILAQPRWHERLPDITHPTLVLHGAADPLIKPDCGRDIAKRIPGAEIDIIDKWGHDLPEKMVPVLLNRIVPFLTRHAPQDTRMDATS